RRGPQSGLCFAPAREAVWGAVCDCRSSASDAAIRTAGRDVHFHAEFRRPFALLRSLPGWLVLLARPGFRPWGGRQDSNGGSEGTARAGPRDEFIGLGHAGSGSTRGGRLCVRRNSREVTVQGNRAVDEGRVMPGHQKARLFADSREAVVTPDVI